MSGGLLAVNWQAGVAWVAIMSVLLGGLAVLVGLAAIVVRQVVRRNDESSEDPRA